MPDISTAGGHYCEIDNNCFEGQICSTSNQCIECDSTPNFARGACHQVQTFGGGGTPAFAEGESGCAGDHCLHACPYDTKCIRVMADMTVLDVTATHNQLPGRLHITEGIREELTRPSSCGGSNAGEADGGMICAGEIWRTVTSKQKTPEAVRSRDLNVVELSVLDSSFETWVSFDEEEMNERAVRRETGHNGRGVVIGYEVPSFIVDGGTGTVTMGKGATGFGLKNWHWGLAGVIQCDVRYSEDEPLHQNWGDIEVDTSIKRSTLLTRVCIRWDGKSEEEKWCGDWGTTSDMGSTLPFKATCTLTGPLVNSFVPTMEQREKMKGGILSALAAKSFSAAELLRISFHDASTYHSDPLEVRGGAQGCMRFEHVHGSSANRGLAQPIDPIPGAVDCQKGSCPFSFADILQYAGSVAVEYAGGPNFSSDIKWGRPDAGYMFCLGELQLHMPDAQGGHNEGAFHVGSSDIQGRLGIVFNSTVAYFEDQLGLSTNEWVAFLGGGHSLGGVKGLISAKNTRFDFDATGHIFDNLYFKSLVVAKNSNLLSLCPQNRRMGQSHFWAPGEEWQSHNDHWQVLIDTDVSMTVHEPTMEFIRLFAEDEAQFFDSFVSGFHKVAELGYDNLSLVPVASTPQAPPSSSPTKAPTGTPVTTTLAPITQAPTVTTTLAPIAQAPISSLPTNAPHTLTCQDNPRKFDFGGKKKHCLFVYKNNRESRCKKFSASQECPVTCKENCTPIDTVGIFTFNGKNRSCDWVEKLPVKRCMKNFFRSKCPVTCNDHTTVYDF